MFAYSGFMRMLISLFAIIVIAVLLTFAGCQSSRSGYKSAPYVIVRSDGNFELRDYPELTVAETSMKEGGSGGSFNRLFRFITGGNKDRQKISMTTPVFMSGSGSDDTMAFVMPAEIGKVSQPTDGAVKVREVPGGRFAVLRFSGSRSRQQETERLDQLKAWMAAQGIGSASSPVYAYFDPPWTPPMLRRNEVMLRTETRPSAR